VGERGEAVVQPPQLGEAIGGVEVVAPVARPEGLVFARNVQLCGRMLRNGPSPDVPNDTHDRSLAA